VKLAHGLRCKGKMHMKENFEMEKEIVRHDLEAEVSQLGCVNVPEILEEITIEEMAVDGICGIY
jgi:mycofactocin precursor